MFKRHFNCGSIRPDRSDKTLKFEVRSIADLVSIVVPHFEKYSLISSKQNDFQRFADICRRIQNKQHLTKEGLQKILELA